MALIITDNGTPFVAALDYLAAKYKIYHIKISPYNSQANGLIERPHRSVRDSLLKAVENDESRWHQAIHSVFWAERVTIQRTSGYSPYYIAHGIEPTLPFDLAEATYLIPLPNDTMTTTDLIAFRARQLQRRHEDLAAIRDRVLKARQSSIAQFIKKHEKSIIDYDFKPGALVLVRNTVYEHKTEQKVKPRYVGPMTVVRRTKGGSYVLAELDGSLSKLRYAAFRLLPYYPRSHISVPVTKLLGIADDELEGMTLEDDDLEPPVSAREDDHVSDDGSFDDRD